MFYLEYEDDTKLVVKIHETEPEAVEKGHSVALSDSFDMGMELEFVITVDAVDQDGKVISSSTVKQLAPAYQLLKKIADSEKEITVLKSQNMDLMLAIAEQAEENELSKLETQLAIAELAEIISGGVV